MDLLLFLIGYGLFISLQIAWVSYRIRTKIDEGQLTIKVFNNETSKVMIQYRATQVPAIETRIDVNGVNYRITRSRLLPEQKIAILNVSPQ